MAFTPARRSLAGIVFAITASLISTPVVATQAEAQVATQEDRCRADLAKTARKYLERVLKYRMKCQTKVITGELALATDCLTGNGDDGLALQLAKAEARLAAAGGGCDGVNLQLLGFPNQCEDDNGFPFDMDDFRECVLERTDEILGTLLDYYYPPMSERAEGDVAGCLRGTPADASKSLRGKMKGREKCLVGQGYGLVPEQVDCYAKTRPYGPGTGDARTDSSVADAYVELLGEVPKSCAILPIAGLGYQDKCPDPTGGGFNILDLKSCLFEANRNATLAELATVFPTEGICGDGNVTNDEECDDGPNNSDTVPNACRTNCMHGECYDGVTDNQFGEECDDGNTVDGDCCTDCIIDECGDGVPNCGEQCDNGSANSNTTPNACRTNCRNPRCGDGVKDPVNQEECDDGNSTLEDGCTTSCQVEECGDEIVQEGIGEQCDDGNTVAEPNECRPAGHPFECQDPFCGDSIVDDEPPFNEVCDDGNTNDNDSCVGCAICGDGIKGGTEQCDGSNAHCPAGESCQTNCDCIAVCGDGLKGGTEECDGSNAHCPAGEACQTNCDCIAVCGDGMKAPSEECDGSNAHCPTGEVCQTNCDCIAVCGDGMKAASEQCDGDDTECPGGKNCQDDCTCLDICPTVGELVLYSGVGEACSNNGDCPVGTCSEGFCRTVTRLDSGWKGIAHRADINNETRTRGFLRCDSNTEPCGECELAGIDPSTRACRCSNNSRTVCDEPFDEDSSDCPACAGGDLEGRTCATNSDCNSTCARRCTTNGLIICSTNADCAGGNGTCPSSATTCADGSTNPCTTNADCVPSTCTANAECFCYFGAPFPLSSGGTPACIVNRFSEAPSGTANVDIGAGEIHAKLRTQVHLGLLTYDPCPTCGGSCSNAPSTFCIIDADCPSGGTCNDDPVPDDGIRGGRCATFPGPDSAKPCDANSFNSSFPARAGTPGGAWYSLDCLPNNPLAGQGLVINLTQTTGTSSMTAQVSCTGNSPELDCHCLVCSGDTSVPCNSDADCSEQQGSCSLSTTSRCNTNSDCLDRNVGPCQGTNRCRFANSIMCSSNTDCQTADVGTCLPSTCSLKGSAGVFPLPNNCVDQLCSATPDGYSECTVGPDTTYCAGLVRANGTGVLSCFSDGDCTSAGVDARPCGLVERQSCFTETISATGDPDPVNPVGAAVFCIPPTGNGTINDVAGLPGPGKVVNQSKARTFCGNDTTKQYIPGVGGCQDE